VLIGAIRLVRRPQIYASSLLLAIVDIVVQGLLAVLGLLLVFDPDKLTGPLNVGTTPKFSMGHNWVLLTLGTDVPQFLAAAAEAVTTEYVPTATHKDHIVVATKLLGPKERDVVTFAAPNAPGRYDFLCSFPGHYQVGMRGVLIGKSDESDRKRNERNVVNTHCRDLPCLRQKS